MLAPMTARRALIIVGAGAALAAALLPADEWAMRTIGPHGGLARHMGGDLVRELEFLQQFGAVTSMLIAGAVILLLDRARARRVLDLALALLLSGLACNALKIALGRPRPRVVFHEHAMEGFSSAKRFAMGTKFPLPRQGEDASWTHLWAHSWEVWRGISSDLWSMPSSHSAAAACAAACLVRLYPRLFPLLLCLMVVVAVCRVLFGAHFPSDCALGMAIGWVIGAATMERGAVSRVASRKSDAL
jgi:membrane-associated phospholipid phosphatase